MTDPRADLREWVAYLRDVGVRDLAVGPSAPAPAPAPVPPPRTESAPPPASSAAPPAAPATPATPAAAGATGAPGLALIRDDIGDCTRCGLHERRTNIVFGVGNPDADLMFVGEGPGAEEDARGEPFVGRAGKKLDEMIVKGLGLRREDVYIANVVKCRPPGNRDPRPEEVAMCREFLFAQIAAIRPRVIVTLGAPAARTLLDTATGITRLRGTWHSFRGIPVMPTFHPAYLLRAYTIENRRRVYDDLLAAVARLGGA